MTRLMRKVVVKQMTFGDGQTYKVGYITTSEKNVSELLQRVLDAHPEVQVACQINLDKGTASLRSRGDVDVAKIATYFNGGGHRAASGHRLPENLLDLIISEVHGE